MARSVREVAMDLLARREHASRELREKLLAKGYAPDEVDPALDTLSREGLLSDERFVEAFVHGRIERGQGPVRIRAELRQRGIADSLIDAWLDERDPDWLARAEAVRRRKFGDAPPADPRERARQGRFLQYRGFTAEQTRRVLRHD